MGDDALRRGKASNIGPVYLLVSTGCTSTVFFIAAVMSRSLPCDTSGELLGECRSQNLIYKRLPPFAVLYSAVGRREAALEVDYT